MSTTSLSLDRAPAGTYNIDTGDEDRDGHLQAPDMFDAAQHPQISFNSILADVSADGQITLTGEITIKSVTKPIELRAAASLAPRRRRGRAVRRTRAAAAVQRGPRHRVATGRSRPPASGSTPPTGCCSQPPSTTAPSPSWSGASTTTRSLVGVA